MPAASEKNVSKPLVLLAFATVYLVWGSTYYFIRVAIQHIPPLLMVCIRFSVAGLIMLLWCAWKKEDIFNKQFIKPAVVSGLLLLFIGNGGVVWVEQYLPSSFVAVLAAAAPIWFVLLDKPNWQVNFKSRETVIGLISGFIGVALLFGEHAMHKQPTGSAGLQIFCLILLTVASIAWSGGSLYSKYFSKGPSTVTTAWQMLSAGVAFLPCSFLSGEWSQFHWQQITGASWTALGYLITMGSLAGYSAYVWLLNVRPSTQVSTYAYVNPVVAVLLGILLAGEKMSSIQLVGLGIILGSVLLVNLAKYRKEKTELVTG